MSDDADVLLADAVWSDPAELAAVVAAMPDTERAYAVNRLSPRRQAELMRALAEADVELAADLLEAFADAQAAAMLDRRAGESAARRADRMDSDEQVDVLSRLEPDKAADVLAVMQPDEALDTQRRLALDPDTAGGLMITEVLAYPQDWTVGHVADDLRAQGTTYNNYEVRYVYEIDGRGRLRGVVPIRTLLLMPADATIASVGNEDVVTVPLDAPLDDLVDLFEHVDYSAVPVVDEDGLLAGVVQRAAVLEARTERSEADLMKVGGIVGGEELRSMPLAGRTLRRLVFLLPNVVLSFVAVSIIAANEDVIAELTALAIFLPMVANLSGASGNQSVAVSIRELSLDVARPRDVWRVWRAEWPIGLVNGVVVGAMLFGLAILTRPDEPIAATSTGLAFLAASLVAVLLGGGIPLVLKALRVDPAMMSSPVLTTLTDTAAFFFTLTIAAALL